MACFCVTACHIQMKGKAYNKFSLPPNQKATAAKAGALRLRGGSTQKTTKEPQQNKSITRSVTSTCREPSCKWQSVLPACQASAFNTLPHTIH